MSEHVKIFNIEKGNTKYIAHVTYTSDTKMCQVKVIKEQDNIHYLMGSVVVKNNEIVPSLSLNQHHVPAANDPNAPTIVNPKQLPIVNPKQLPIVNPNEPPAVNQLTLNREKTAKNRGYTGMFHNMYTSTNKDSDKWRKMLNGTYIKPSNPKTPLPPPLL
jgi:hypothetical protein